MKNNKKKRDTSQKSLSLCPSCRVNEMHKRIWFKNKQKSSKTMFTLLPRLEKVGQQKLDVGAAR